MSFEIDVQTYQDLNIFPSGHTEFCVYHLFNNCQTTYGNQKIQEMMRQPMADIFKLQERTAALHFLSKNKTTLATNDIELELILHYLNYGKSHLKDNLIDAFAVYIKNKFSETQDYYVIKSGIKRLLKLLRYCYELIGFLNRDDTPIELKRISAGINAIVEKLAISKTKIFTDKTPHFLTLSKLDAKLRQREHKLLLNQLLDYLYEIDALQGIANSCSETNLSIPYYTNDDDEVKVRIQGLFHPAISSAIKNDVEINKDNHLIFLTGSNMAGKSSLLKSLGLAIYLSHIGFPVPANSMQTSIFNGLVSTINIADNVRNGLSHYLSEVLRVKYLLKVLIEKQKVFVILDELFKGTNAKDASEATALVVDGFSKISNSVFLISSHITELTDIFRNDQVSLMHMEHFIQDGKPVFTYKFKKGITKDGIGMYFIHNENIPTLLKDAQKASLYTQTMSKNSN